MNAEGRIRFTTKNTDVERLTKLMPYQIESREGKYVVVKKNTGEPVPGGIHETKEMAEHQIHLLESLENDPPDNEQEDSGEIVAVVEEETDESDPEDNEIDMETDQEKIDLKAEVAKLREQLQNPPASRTRRELEDLREDNKKINSTLNRILKKLDINETADQGIVTPVVTDNSEPKADTTVTDATPLEVRQAAKGFNRSIRQRRDSVNG